MVEEEVGGVLPGPLVGAEMSLKATSCLTLAGRDATGNILHNKFSVVGARALTRSRTRTGANGEIQLFDIWFGSARPTLAVPT